VVLGFELMASYLLGRCSITWFKPPFLFCFSYFLDRLSHFCWGLASDHNPPPTYASSWGSGTHHCNLFVEMGSCFLSQPGLQIVMPVTPKYWGL
jgi:hypothetical protein